ncbi:MAG TPA: hypothetical protein VKB93_13110 [Thermoanaerobaculia bacterium]|nr:hypothetical protein [Thermoanaerobaculia bacterium]
MRFELIDITLRTLILLAGGVAALLLAREGYGPAIPAVAVGGALGAFFASRAQPREDN